MPNIIFNFIFIAASISVVLIFYKNIMLTNILLIIIAIIGICKYKSKLSLIIFIFFGIIFGVAESIVSTMGPWTYEVSNTMNIPSWLFILWGNTAVFIHQTIREIRKLGIKEDKLKI